MADNLMAGTARGGAKGAKNACSWLNAYNAPWRAEKP
jgi:hypothetical protein